MIISEISGVVTLSEILIEILIDFFYNFPLEYDSKSQITLRSSQIISDVVCGHHKHLRFSLRLLRLVKRSEIG